MKPYKRKEVIGDCTLYLGDCMDVMPMLGKFDCVVTDPPYGMMFNSNHRKIKHKNIANDDTISLLKFACEIKVSHSAYVFCRWDNIRDIPQPKSLITWVKNNWSMGDLKHEHARQTEVAAFYAGEDHFFQNGRPQDVVRHARTTNSFHPTQKPVGLMQSFVRWTSGEVLDPFMGSCSTGVACVKLGRKFTGIELDEDYFNIACDRIRKAYDQPDLFVNPPKQEPMEQLNLMDDAD